MTSRLLLAILVASLVAAQAHAVAQVAAGDVTLKIPLNLTKLSADLVKVRLSCGLQSTAIRFHNPVTNQDTQTAIAAVEVPVANGQVVTTATAVFSNFTLVNPAGVTATYNCTLMAYDKNGTGGSLTEGQPQPQFRVSPSVFQQGGSFTW